MSIFVIGGLVYQGSDLLGIFLLEVLRMPLIIVHELRVRALDIFRDFAVSDYRKVWVAVSHAWFIS